MARCVPPGQELACLPLANRIHPTWLSLRRLPARWRAQQKPSEPWPKTTRRRKRGICGGSPSGEVDASSVATGSQHPRRASVPIRPPSAPAIDSESPPKCRRLQGDTHRLPGPSPDPAVLVTQPTGIATSQAPREKGTMSPRGAPGELPPNTLLTPDNDDDRSAVVDEKGEPPRRRRPHCLHEPSLQHRGIGSDGASRLGDSSTRGDVTVSPAAAGAGGVCQVGKAGSELGKVVETGRESREISSARHREGFGPSSPTVPSGASSQCHGSGGSRGPPLGKQEKPEGGPIGGRLSAAVEEASLVTTRCIDDRNNRRSPPLGTKRKAPSVTPSTRRLPDQALPPPTSGGTRAREDLGSAAAVEGGDGQAGEPIDSSRQPADAEQASPPRGEQGRGSGEALGRALSRTAGHDADMSGKNER